jgi:hypothetical protein
MGAAVDGAALPRSAVNAPEAETGTPMAQSVSIIDGAPRGDPQAILLRGHGAVKHAHRPGQGLSGRPVPDVLGQSPYP